MRLRLHFNEPLRAATRAYRDADRRSAQIAGDFLPMARTGCDRIAALNWLAGEEHYLAELVPLGSRLLDDTAVADRIQGHLWAADLAGMIATAEHAADHGQGYRFGGYGLEADNWTVYLLGTYATARNLAGRAAVLDSLATHLHRRGYSDRVIGAAAAIADAFRRTSR
ncbi:hypothetical protein DL990_20080 [Amycolatopsis sp. WAC 01416]|uniref:hypothetical protein n=1 Tax=Amycolatopsis sp. WAC 01416 TaxID=2203196 RepID=UPI000F76F996|nr:hypothetical protein [Amycolatopsis sp. WAC 01416]RSN32220.1 hypothetical protein DL990_20080 [Amycolatopsis sp. WAC 01416]